MFDSAVLEYHCFIWCRVVMSRVFRRPFEEQNHALQHWTKEPTLLSETVHYRLLPCIIESRIPSTVLDGVFANVDF